MTTRFGGTGLLLALGSAATFGTSGTFATALIDAGWTPGAAVTTRITLAAALLTGPALLSLRGRWGLLRRGGRGIAAYGLVAVVGAQLFFFNAVEHLSVGIALLLEYLGIVLVVGWMWVRHGQRPRRLTVLGAVVAIAGLAFVIDLTGSHHVDMVGVLWGLGAGVGLATYFVLSSATDNPVPPVAMAWAGLVVGGAALTLGAVVGALPMHARFVDVRLADHQVSWIVPVIGVALISTVIGYVSGIGAARVLGARLASFVGLSEVLFAVLFAWLFLGQLPGGMQLAGAVLIIAGVTLVRVDELLGARRQSVRAQASYPPITSDTSRTPSARR